MIAGVLAVTFGQPVLAGGMSNKATETTQLMNNLELGFLVSDSAQDVIVQAEQLAKQYGMLTNMLQMAQQIQGGNFEVLGLKLPDEIKTIATTYARAKNIYDSVQQTNETLTWYAKAAVDTGIQPTAIFDYIKRQGDAGRVELRAMVEEDNRRFQRYEQSAKDLAELSQRTGSAVKGTVAGLQHLAAVAVKHASINEEMRRATDQLVANDNMRNLQEADATAASREIMRTLVEREKRALQNIERAFQPPPKK